MLQTYAVSFNYGEKTASILVKAAAYYVAYAKAREMMSNYHVQVTKIKRVYTE